MFHSCWLCQSLKRCASPLQDLTVSSSILQLHCITGVRHRKDYIVIYILLVCGTWGGGTSTQSQESSDMVSSWNPKTETWYTNMAMKNSSTIAESLTSCYALLEGAWSARSEGFKFISEPKLRHALSSCKAFINLAISKELSACETEASYWYSVNLLSSAISTVLFIAMTCLIARLRRSNRVKSKMKRYLPERWFDKGNKSKSWFH